MTALEKLLLQSFEQSMTLARTTTILAVTAEQLIASTNMVTEQKAEIVRLKGEVTMLRLDLAEARAKGGEGHETQTACQWNEALLCLRCLAVARVLSPQSPKLGWPSRLLPPLHEERIHAAVCHGEAAPAVCCQTVSIGEPGEAKSDRAAL